MSINSQFYGEENKASYLHHNKPHNFYNRMISTTSYLPLSPRTGKPFYLTPYRFRYTVGSNAVMEGMTEEDKTKYRESARKLFALCKKHSITVVHEARLIDAVDKAIREALGMEESELY